MGLLVEEALKQEIFIKVGPSPLGFYGATAFCARTLKEYRDNAATGPIAVCKVFLKRRGSTFNKREIVLQITTLRLSKRKTVGFRPTVIAFLIFLFSVHTGVHFFSLTLSGHHVRL